MLDLFIPQVMGILNVTPDSFSDGGKFEDVERALQHALDMQSQGAALIDIGGESTRPDAAVVELQEELDRVIPVIERLTAELAIPVSIDTSKPQVMTEAVRAGAAMINDVNALRADGAVEAAVQCQVPVCLMHMAGNPRNMQQAPRYVDVVQEVKDFLAQRVADCVAAGIDKQQIVLDPGFGFGKTLQHNMALLAGLHTLVEMGMPVMVGMSRKSMLGALTGRDADDRLAASVSVAVLALERGANILRVHDVAETVDALKVVSALRE